MLCDAQLYSVATICVALRCVCLRCAFDLIYVCLLSKRRRSVGVLLLQFVPMRRKKYQIAADGAVRYVNDSLATRDLVSLTNLLRIRSFV